MNELFLAFFFFLFFFLLFFLLFFFLNLDSLLAQFVTMAKTLVPKYLIFPEVFLAVSETHYVLIQREGFCVTQSGTNKVLFIEQGHVLYFSFVLA